MQHKLSEQSIKEKKVGSFSDVASFSFNVMKNVGGFGKLAL